MQENKKGFSKYTVLMYYWFSWKL